MTGKNKRKCIAAALLSLLIAASGGSAMVAQAAEPSAVFAAQEWESSAAGSASKTAEKKKESYAAKGTCGQKLTWTLSRSGVLTISGKGDMTRYNAKGDRDKDALAAPWSKYADDVREIVIEDGVRTIGDYAFDRCDNVKKLTIPSSVRNTYGQPLAGIDDTVEHLIIGADLYRREIALNGWGKDTLQKIELLDGVTAIKGHDFFEYEKLTTVILPSTVKSIGQGAFSSCKSLKKIVLTEGVESIGNGAFAELEKLETATLPSTVKTLGEGAFAGCSGLRTVTLSENLRQIQNDTFRDCTVLETVILPEGVEKIGDNAFNGCSDLKTITIPSSVKTIGKEAFASCSSLTGAIVIPDNVIALGEKAFYQCKNLTEVTLSGDLREIADKTFASCKKLKKITVPSGVKIIGDEAFAGCSTLQEAVLSDGITTLGEKVFAETAFKTITVPDSVTTIGAGAFTSCAKLTTAVLSQNITTIENELFDQCDALKNITIPGRVSRIGDRAFAETAISTVALPDSVSAIGKDAFRDSKLEEIILTDHVTTLDKGAFANTDLTGLTLPKRLKEIPDALLKDCASLSIITIPSRVTKIGKDAFSGSGLQEITFEGDLPKAAENAFGDLTLTAVYGKLSISTPSKTYGDAKEITWHKPLVPEKERPAEKDFTGAVIFVENQTFTGQALTPSVAVIEGDTKLEAGVDYTVAYQDNTAIGTGKVIVTGMGVYSGTVTESFKIKAIPAKEIFVSSLEDQVYTGESIKPKLILRHNGVLLEKGEDYDLSYENNEDVGTASAVITLQGNYSGTKTVDFTINPAKVTGLQADAGTDTVKLTWKKVTGADSYVVYRWNAAESDWVKIKTTDKLTYTDHDCQSGTKNRYRVKACKTVDDVRYEGEAATVFAMTSLAKVTGLTASGNTGNSVDLAWNAVTGAEGYFVSRKNAEGEWQKLAETDGLTYTDTGLQAGGAYEYAVKAYRTMDGTQQSGSQQTVKTATVPTKVSGFTVAESTESAVTLQWKKVSGAATYLVYRWNVEKEQWQEMGSTDQLTYTDSGLRAGAEYEYAIRACRKAGDEILKSAAVTTTATTTPAKMTGLQVTASTDDTITLQWNRADGAAGYTIYQKKAGEDQWTLLEYTDSFTYTNRFLQSGTVYQYAVRAYAVLNGEEILGKMASVKTATSPAAITGLTAKVKADAVGLSWNMVSGADGYIVYRWDSSKNAWKKLKTVKDCAYTDSKRKKNTSYQYAVKAYTALDGKTYSGQGVTVTAKTNALRTASITAAAKNDGTVALNWSAAEGADGYRVYRWNAEAEKWNRIATTGETSFIDTGAKDNASNRYTVCAYTQAEDAAVCGPSIKSKAIVPVNMTQPVLRSVCKYTENGKPAVRVEWDAVPGAQYCILRRTANTGYSKIDTVMAKSAAGVYVDQKAEAGVEYTYTVYRHLEKNKKVLTSGYDMAGITTITAKPAMEADRTNTQAEISWQKVSGVDGYAIFRKLKLSDKDWTEVVRVDADTDYYMDVYADTFGEQEKSRLISGQYLDPSRYSVTYTVKAYHEENGKISYSDFYADGDFTLEAPSIISASQKEDTVTLKWGASANAEQYIIYMAKPSNGTRNWVEVKTVKAASSKEETAKLEAKKGYTCFAVKAAADQNGQTVYSAMDEGFCVGDRKYSSTNVLYLGDSITFGTPYVDEVYSYPWRVAQLTGVQYYNPSIPGATYCYRPHRGTGAKRARLVTDVVEKIRNGETPEQALHKSTQTFADFDVVILAAGTNDYYYNSPMGERDSTDITEFNGAVNAILQYIAEANVQRAASGKAAIKVIFVDLFYSSKVYGFPNETGDRFSVQNSLGYTLTDYQKGLDALADKYRAMGMEIYHFETDQIVTAENCGTATCDNLHMTRFTYAQIGNQLAEYLMENRILS